MATRLTIDPVTRIEGHLRIDVALDNGKVSDAWAACTMWRGIENILLTKDSREAWLFAQRFCGVCTTVHAMASVRAIEDALDLEIPPNAQYIRNLILIGHALHDHIVHFYHLSALDWVDVTTVLDANPVVASKIANDLAPWENNSEIKMANVKQRVEALVNSGQLGIFAHGYWGHPAMKLPPEVNLIALAHYFEALDFQRSCNQIVGILGGKTPHIQNLAVGGVMNAINLDSQAAMNMDRLYQIKSLFDRVVPFVQDVYLTDQCAIAANYPEWFDIGRGVDNYLSTPDLPINAAATEFELPGGVIFEGDLSGASPIENWKDARIRKAVTEDVTRAWYAGEGAKQPWQGETVPNYTEWEAEGKYTFVKAPRYEKRPMQVGPVAQILAGYAQGHALTKKWTDIALERINALSSRRVTVNDLRSTMGRYVARAIRSAMLAEVATKHWQLLADNVLSGDGRVFEMPQFPDTAVEGLGLHEAPRGLLSHWVVVEKGLVKNYQAVVPTTWNASPRDEAGVPGPYEESLVGTPIADPDSPLEVLRTVHSYDPCMACACHTFDGDGEPISRIKVL